jgi:hypothetical protein
MLSQTHDATPVLCNATIGIGDYPPVLVLSRWCPHPVQCCPGAVVMLCNAARDLLAAVKERRTGLT